MAYNEPHALTQQGEPPASSLAIPKRFLPGSPSVKLTPSFGSSTVLGTGKSLLIPGPGKQPTFEEVAAIALTGAIFGQTVCVICLTREMLDRWMQQLITASTPVANLEYLDPCDTTLAEWKAYLGRQHYDLTVLHGVEAALQARRLSVGYLQALVGAVPAGLVLVA